MYINLRVSTARWGRALLGAAAILAGCTATGDDVGWLADPLAGKDGAQTIATQNQFVNTYADLSVNAAKGATAITVSSTAGLGFITPGDLLMIIQMQGATIDTIDSSGYGNIIGLNGAGLYELVTVTSVAGNVLNLDGRCGGLRNSYSVAGRTQVVRVPQYTTLSIPDGTSVTAPPWNGITGGVIAMYAQTGISLGSTAKIDASGLGFRGGAANANGRAVTTTLVGLYRSIDPMDGGEKGESIAGYEADLASGRYGRGAPANGGGGGNWARAGGGGGANGDNRKTWSGQGVMDGVAYGTLAWQLDPDYTANGNKLTDSSGGGRGGYSLANQDLDARTSAPGSTLWLGNLRQEVGGLGGHPLRNDPATRLFLGGGGGAGDEISTSGSGSGGGSGGGLVFIMTRDLTGTGGAAILANGSAGQNSRAPNDGAGGGGAGGTVVISASRTLAGVAVQATGGAGGSNASAAPQSQGPGGGGGGGFIALAGGNVSATTTPGGAGISTASAVAEFPYNGATGGATGEPTASARLPAQTFYPACVAADVTVTVAPGLGPVAPGSTASFTVTIRNAGPNPLFDLTLAETSPWTGSAASYTCTPSSGATCPSASGNGSIAGRIDLPVGEQLVYAISGPVPTTMTAGNLQYTLAALLPSGYSDPTPMDDSATASIGVLSGNIIDLSLSVVTDPVEPAVGEPVTYDFTVSSQGPGTTNAPTVSFTLPAGAGLLGVTLGDSWNCSTANQLVTCTRAVAIPIGGASHLRLQVAPPAGAAAMRIVAVASASDGTDKNPADNTVTWDVAIGRSTLYGTGGGLGCAQAGREPSPAGAVLVGIGLVALALGAGRRRRPAAGRG